MSRVTYKLLKSLLGEVAKELNISTKREMAPEGSNTFYKEPFLYLDHNSVYGGYNIRYVGERGGSSEDFFSTQDRMSASEMYYHLTGMLCILNRQREYWLECNYGKNYKDKIKEE